MMMSFDWSRRSFLTTSLGWGGDSLAAIGFASGAIEPSWWPSHGLCGNI